MTIKTSTIRPGLLVSLKTSVRGNVSYSKRIIEAAAVDENGVQKASWETVRTITDPKEHEDARLARAKARTAIVRVCKQSTFGLLCPEADGDELEKAIADARIVAAEFNVTAKLSKVSVYVITGRIAPNDIEAVKAINGEVSELLEEMERGIGEADVKAIREAAGKAKGIAEMLSQEARVQAEIAIEAARKAAREIVKADGKAVSVDRRAMRTIAEARTAFLDLDDAAEIGTPAAPGRTLDLGAE